MSTQETTTKTPITTPCDDCHDVLGSTPRFLGLEEHLENIYGSGAVPCCPWVDGDFLNHVDPRP